MKTNREIRKEAFGVVRSGWLWRIAIVMFTLFYAAQTVFGFLTHVLKSSGVQTWDDFLLSAARMRMNGLDYCVPSSKVAWQMTGASSFSWFFGYIFMAIVAVGIATVALKAVRNDSDRWFRKSLDGVKRPFGNAWLLLLMNLKTMLWSLLFLIPGIVAMYRYRQAVYVRVERPDLSASECIAESSRMMQGRKGQAFCLDCWFLSVAVLMALVVLGAVGLGHSLGAFGAIVVELATIAFMVGINLLFVVYFTARTVFYRELVSASCGSNSLESLS